MARSAIDYGRLVEQALRTVVRDVLRRLATEGLPPPHHFYITFRTSDPGVEMPEYLRERYPNEMTVVLQYQYWDLEVDDHGLSVTLSFNDVPHRLRIPFHAIKVFADPGAEFGLQFTLEPEIVPLASSERKPQTPAKKDEEEPRGPPKGGAEIVALDRFRKK
ncbi:MAG: ClpXP protease specificity-enhancing factor SspB [Geminicoccaceae bacterium]|nr:ClpXP protease specificity-enhancing factor SspB [Geminicoccaceae bacterium]MCS7266495.1 ClpXP protease specificity-enhancing factor SspB [Geminicoccaceae bacterium]MCX7631324.1 ClpXP protease specificity-enhancing factor SspB [Geminicoccaceae bacterium]MDW8123909.1 ClpXP protease specificity-enhancing factor SspB [Geminicoccaceae bacterium]MDW8340028.1 ClpXP protease specificity-enhancing factor SspB [Geminicoccaceae bacterium]